jgi:hypothetical protein
MRAFENALKLGFDDFTFRLKPKAHQMDMVDTVRVEVAVQYRTRGWQTIDVDLGPAGAAEVDLVVPTVKGLVEMNLAVPSWVPCIGTNDQVAQKLHACTAPGAQGRVLVLKQEQDACGSARSKRPSAIGSSTTISSRARIGVRAPLCRKKPSLPHRPLVESQFTELRVLLRAGADFTHDSLHSSNNYRCNGAIITSPRLL